MTKRTVPRRTKIVATLGPATESEEAIDAVLKAGADVLRFNFSHGTAEEHIARAERVRRIGMNNNRHLAILADLQGPKIRIEKFRDGAIELKRDMDFCLDTACPADDGDINRVGVTYKGLPGDLKAGDKLVLDDGLLVLRVESVQGTKVHCNVRVGGILSNNKGINLRGGGLTADVVTEKDKADIVTSAQLQADYVAVSFPRSGDDIRFVRELLQEAGSHAGIVAKIERAEAVENIEDILEASEAIMIARGDLGVELGDANLPSVQKELISLARDRNRVVITATQMMESMRENPVPTRAEVFDVANAVLDGTDAVMLSAETASGKYPAETVHSMSQICYNAEGHRKISSHRLHSTFDQVDEAIAMASMYTANHLGVRAIASLTESGSTALWMSRISSGIPIYALSRHKSTLRKVNLYRGVFPVTFPTVHTNHAQANLAAVEAMLAENTIADGDLVIITKGDLMGTGGGTNAMKIVEVGNMPDFAE